MEDYRSRNAACKRVNVKIRWPNRSGNSVSSCRLSYPVSLTSSSESTTAAQSAAFYFRTDALEHPRLVVAIDANSMKRDEAVWTGAWARLGCFRGPSHVAALVSLGPFAQIRTNTVAKRLRKTAPFVSRVVVPDGDASRRFLVRERGNQWLNLRCSGILRLGREWLRHGNGPTGGTCA